jgi:hypothetical protein
MHVFALWLFMVFCAAQEGNPQAQALYDGMVSDGASCYVYESSWGNDTSPMPPCWYDPSNTNPELIF